MSVPILSSSSQLSIQGIHASNTSATPIITSYPSSNTSSSLGHYHFVDETTKASNHLNVSASATGGHIFSHASSTQAPLEIMKVNRTGLSLDTQLKNTSNNTILNMVSNDLKFTNDLSISFLNNEAFSFKYNGATNTQINNSPENPNIIFTSNLHNSQLTASNLTFDGVSLPSSVATNTSNIATNTSNIATNTSNIATNTSKIATNTSNIATNTTNIATNTTNIATNTTDIQNLKNKDLQVVVSQITLSSPAIYADSSIAPQPSQFLATYGYGGWGYKKASPQSSNAKINYYFPSPKINGTVGDLKGLYYQIFNNCSGVGDLPFFTVYTRPTGVNDYKSWYHSSMTYVPDANSPANQSCQMFMNIKNLNFTPYSVNVQNQISMSQSTVSNPKGIYADTDVILFIAFGTNSASAYNSVDFVVSKVGMITDFSTEFLLF